MKAALLFSILVLSASCGKIKPIEGAGQVGSVRALQVTSISTGELLAFDRICQSLTRKSGKLEAALPNSISFAVVEKDCEKNPVTTANQAVRIEKAGTGEFQFRRQDTNSLFVFPKVETQNFGVMKEICAGATQMPVISGDSATWVILSGISDSDCPSKSNEICLAIERGSKELNVQNAYRIHTREYMRINLDLNDGNNGYFTYRKAFATNNCDEGKFTETSATLR